MDEAITRVTEKLEGWGEGLVAMLPNFVVAVLVVAAFWLAARLVRRAVLKASQRVGQRRSVSRLLAALATWAVVIVGFFVALGVMNLDKTVSSLLAGAGIAGLALGLAVQSLAASLMAGVMLSLRGKLKVGDLVESNGHFGTVEAIDLRTTSLRKPQGQLAVIPNKEILENPFVNYSSRNDRRVDLEVGVSYSDDLEAARRIAIEAVSGVSGRVEDREPELFYTEFGGSSINFVVRFWIDFERQGDFLSARSEAIQRVKRAFDDEGISIPFPIRTLDWSLVDAAPLARLAAGGGESAPAG